MIFCMVSWRLVKMSVLKSDVWVCYLVIEKPSLYALVNSNSTVGAKHSRYTYFFEIIPLLPTCFIWLFLLCFHALLCGPGPLLHIHELYTSTQKQCCVCFCNYIWNQEVFKKKDIKKRKETSLVDHQIGMGLNNNFIQALSLCPVPPLVFSVIRKYAT